MSTTKLFLDQGIAVDFIEGPTATVCWVSTPDGDFQATGEAKLAPNDLHDTEIGQLLSMGRALESLSEVITDYAIKRGYHT